MKSAGLLTTFTVLVHSQSIYGQQHGSQNYQNLETHNLIFHQPPTNAVNCVQRLLNQNENPGTLPNNVNQNEMQMQLNLVPSLSIPHQTELPKELQPQSLQQLHGLQHPLIQQTPGIPENFNLLQPSIVEHHVNNNQSPSSIQPLTFQPQTVLSNLQPKAPQLSNQPLNSQSNIHQIHSEASLQQINSHPNIQTISSQFNPQQINSQPNIGVISPQPHFQSISPQLNHQTTDVQTNLQSTNFFSNLQQTNSQANQPISSQNNFQPRGSQFSFQHLNTQPNILPLNISQNTHLDQLMNSKVSTDNVNRHPQENPISIAADLAHYPLPATENRDHLSIAYSTVSQQPPSTPPSLPIDFNNAPITVIPSYKIKPVDQTIVAKYNYITNSDVQPAIVELPKAVNAAPALPPVLAITSPTVQNTNAQTYYYNQQLSDPRLSLYYNQKTYPQQSQMTVATLQSHPKASLSPSQSILSSFPISILQTPAISPKYLLNSGYPPNAVLAPVYTSQKTKTTNLKSFLPLIFNLLKEKLNSDACQNSCACDCKNRATATEPEMLSGYSNQKRYGTIGENTLSVLNTASEEIESSVCPRERKNCYKEENDETEDSDETQEDDDSGEEEVDDEED